MISCKAISKSYSKGANVVTPLENLSLEVPRGEFLALMGPSGSGKTTLLNLLSGIDSPSSGTLEIDGENIAKFSRKQLTKWRGNKVGYIFQLYHLIPVLTASMGKLSSWSPTTGSPPPPPTAPCTWRKANFSPKTRTPPSHDRPPITCHQATRPPPAQDGADSAWGGLRDVPFHIG